MVLAWTRRRRGRRRCREVPSPGVSPYRNLDVAHSRSSHTLAVLLSSLPHDLFTQRSRMSWSSSLVIVAQNYRASCV